MSNAHFTKIIHLGSTDAGRVFVKIEWNGKRLSLTGVEGPMKNGNCRGSCGQIDISSTRFKAFTKGWDGALVEELHEIWRQWHLNDMRAGCEHQRAEGWNEKPIDPSKPLDAYGKHFEGQRHESWNMLVWVTRKDHPEGLLSHPCPTCGYKYGSAWLHEDVPHDVLGFLCNLPDSTIEPAWV